MKLQTLAIPLGRIVITPNALESLYFADVEEAISKHSLGNWGEVCAEDAAENDLAVLEDCRILSTYTDRQGVKFWIITEADRSSTTILLPEDY